jgi:hypothetical protein
VSKPSLVLYNSDLKDVLPINVVDFLTKNLFEEFDLFDSFAFFFMFNPLLTVPTPRAMRVILIIHTYICATSVTPHLLPPVII